MPFNLNTLVRPNILALEPYRCARDDFKEGILLDANENAHGPAIQDLDDEEQLLQLHRYPDPHQLELKKLIVEFRNAENVFDVDKQDIITPENLCLGVGSDESIDALIRTVCRPTKDKLLICPPTYGMYSICATINEVEIVKVPLNLDTFQIDPEEINKAIANDPTIKIVYITTPGNPTGTLIDFKLIEKVLNNENFNGVVVADEAYVDFAPVGSSLATLVNKYPNLVVMQTLSKSFGLAAIRLGITFATKRLAGILNALKAPYNISTLTSSVATRAVSSQSIKHMREVVQLLNSERSRLVDELLKFPNVSKLLGGESANFLLVQVVDKKGDPSSEDAKYIYEKLATTKGVVIRYRGNELGCPGGLRITVGTKEENDILLEKFQDVSKDLL
ncbi:K00817 histidinol-phosphate aminotransferase [Cyberlindnera jadinii]|uniref:histidinol-phosphate transaminase n=1 Tax=Cyberlindnera jadinii (strain ATCC 18201 / CBS 1600 / BCRC 20928 / JCM 3617 / NBRC 0987 / NRRL Y-1542) TaxID=983966 RepID=A0A0H5BZI5_CYBJN|nr:K00817 histidinol-phosphate aminotransferase [Cyberlindnera jadinii]